MNLSEYTLEQRRQVVDTRQLWDAYGRSRLRAESYGGTMFWKTIAGRDYLLRRTGGANRSERSLGPRGPETEQKLANFTQGREATKQAVATQATKLAEIGRVNRAMNLARVPLVAAKIIRVLHRNNLLGRKLVVAGTHALFAYEAEAGVFVGSNIIATGDLDILLDTRARLHLRGNASPPLLLELLRQADASFVMMNRSGTAENRDGYQVDLIKPRPATVLQSLESDFIGGDADLQAYHIANLRWIANAPKFEAMAIGEDGLPVPMVCPDPRAFALYKLWMARRDRTRDPVKRHRDEKQARVVAEIVHRYLPMLPFLPEHLASFPKAATELGSDLYAAGL